MTTIPFLDRALPKWSMILVRGKSVTREQAADIIFRTCDNLIMSNDRPFMAKLARLFGLEQSSSSIILYGSIAEKLRMLTFTGTYGNDGNIDYLCNDRIASNWVGGLKGWCNWDGVIFCNNYNIGKWPSISEIYDEWTAIAKAFPFLELSCQLFSEEECTIHDHAVPHYPIIQFDIKDGTATMREPDPTFAIGAKPEDPAEALIASLSHIQGSVTREHPSFEFIEQEFKAFVERMDKLDEK